VKAIFLIGAACLTALLTLTSCGELVTGCHGDALRLTATVPQGVTVHVGGSVIANAGERHGICESPPPRNFVWRLSTDTVVSLSLVDASHARLTGIRPGSVIVTPVYQSNNVAVPTITIVVVP